MSRILITGATGFVGSAITEKCVEAGMEVRTIGRSPRPPAVARDHHRVDLGDSQGLRKVAEGIDCIVHVAGLAHIFKLDPALSSQFFTVNATGTKHVVEAAAAAAVRRVVLISSVSVYGAGRNNAGDETSQCLPGSPYAESKYLSEQLATDIAGRHGIALTILRLATVYGEGDPGNLTRLIRLIDRGRFIRIGPGTNRKSLIHRDDVARACVRVLETFPDQPGFYNVSAEPHTMRDIVSRLATLLGRSTATWYLPSAPLVRLTGLVTRISRDNAKLAAANTSLKKWLSDDSYAGVKFEHTFQCQPAVSLDAGLQRHVAWYRGALQGARV